jgi:cysteine desulfurase family protein
MIYLDHAATSYPKPSVVEEALVRAVREAGGNPGRSGHELSIAAGEILFAARDAAASLFNLSNPMRVIFTLNATAALNLAIRGSVRQGARVVTTSMEHNAVARTLRELERNGVITLTIVGCSTHGELDIDAFVRAIDGADCAVVNHGSNVTGTAVQLDEIARRCRTSGVCLIADCAQSAGTLPIDMKNGPDMAAVAGHKGLLGTAGTGLLLLNDQLDAGTVAPLITGGTGSNSAHDFQPDFLPDRFESGTPNVPGIASLAAGIGYLQNEIGGVANVYAHKRRLVDRFYERAVDSVKGFMPVVPAEKIQTGVISFNVDGFTPSQIEEQFAGRFGIFCRSGLQCAPWAHQSVGTSAHGTVRISFGFSNTEEEIDTAVDALATIVCEK